MKPGRKENGLISLPLGDKMLKVVAPFAMLVAMLLTLLLFPLYLLTGNSWNDIGQFCDELFETFVETLGFDVVNW